MVSSHDNCPASCCRVLAATSFLSWEPVSGMYRISGRQLTAAQQHPPGCNNTKSTVVKLVSARSGCQRIFWDPAWCCHCDLLVAQTARHNRGKTFVAFHTVADPALDEGEGSRFQLRCWPLSPSSIATWELARELGGLPRKFSKTRCSMALFPGNLNTFSCLSHRSSFVSY